VKRESEKAVLVNVRYGDVARKDVWFPKSQIEIRDGEVFASSWILDQKSERFGSEIHHIETDGLKASPEMVEALKDVKPF
jgi:hypothetical protein